MEEQTPAKRSVAELAGKFKNAAADEPGPAPKPVRRRPPRTLQIPIAAPAEPEKADGATSPLAAGRPKRNSALIEKLQANLALSPCALSPCALMASPKSPGFKFAAPSFVPPSPSPSPSSASVAAVTPETPTSPPPLLSPQGEEEAPVTFETPATAQDGAVLVSINKSRARLSIKRRPPSRRHRTSSSGEEVGVSPSTEDTPPLATPSQPGEEKPMGEGEGEGEGGGATLQSQEAVEPEAASGGGQGPPSAMDHEGPEVTHPAPPPDPQAPNSTETDGGGGGGGGAGSEERGTQSGGQSEGKPDECIAMGEEEEGASGSQDRPVGDAVSSADMEDEE